MAAPIRRTNPALTDSRTHLAYQPHETRRMTSAPSQSISDVVTGALDAPEMQASVRFWLSRWAGEHEAKAHELRRAAADIGAEIASMESDAARCWQEYADLKDIRGGRPHPNPHYEGQYQWLKRHIPDLDRSIAHARGDWTRMLAEARRHEDSAVRLRAAALAEMHG